MARSGNDILKLLIGDLVFQVATLQSELEQRDETIKKLTETPKILIEPPVEK